MSPRDVLHQHVGPTTEWSRVNIAEVVPGVQTPLSWCVWDEMERSFRAAYTRMGLLPRSEARVPTNIDDQFTAVFYGRAASNLTVLRRARAMPSSASEAARDGLFASIGVESRPATRVRRSIVRVWLPISASIAPVRLRRLRARSEAFWRESLISLQTASRAEATALLREAVERAVHEVSTQIIVTTLVLLRHGEVQSMLQERGREDLAMALIGGHSTSEETRLAASLWDVAHGRETLAGFLSRYGYQGPAVGELSSFSWREDSGPVDVLLKSLTLASEDGDPRKAEARSLAARKAAESELVSGSSHVARWKLRRTLNRAERVLPLRVVAKAAFTQTLDVARAASRVIGDRLVAEGLIDSCEDVFYLSLAELYDDERDVRATVEARKQQREEYSVYELPLLFTGMPEPIKPAPAVSDAGTENRERTIVGLGASHGIAEGDVRVLLDPNDAGDLEPGYVLVCHTTDPSWISYFLLAGAVVIDIGGILSHGAIVARELGIPCVINTLTGTQALQNGDRVRVDGDRGEVEILAGSAR